MKKVLVLLIVGFVFFGCTAQNVNAQSSNDAQRIVGTWKNTRNDTFTFNSNGTFLITRGDGAPGTLNGDYFLSGSKLVVNERANGVMFWDYFLSTDSKTLVLVINRGRDVYITGNYWLMKQ